MRHRQSICITLVTAIVASAFAVPAFGARTDLLATRNGNFETGGGPDSMPLYWAKEAGIPNNVTTWSVGQYGAGPHTGTYFMLNASNWAGNRGVIISDEIFLTPGSYNLALSFWVWVHDDGWLPSMVGGELLVDGQVASAAVKSCMNSASPTHGYQKLWATWSGEVTSSVQVRFTLVVDGPGGWGIVALDDAELWAMQCPGDCSTQHEITDVDPHAANMPVSTDTTVTISGANFSGIAADDVYLWKTLTGNYNANPVPPNGLVVPGTIDSNTGTSMSVTFATTGLEAGVFDLVVMKSGCNPVVVSNAFEILDPDATQNLLANSSFEVVNLDADGVPTAPRDAVGSAALWLGDYIKNPAANPNPTSIDYRTPLPPDNPKNGFFDYWGIWSISSGTPSEKKETSMWQTVAVAPGSQVSFGGWLDVNAFGTVSNGQITVTLYDADFKDEGSIIASNRATPVTQETPGTEGTWSELTLSGTANSGYVTVELASMVECIGGGGNEVGAFADAFRLTASPKCDSPLRPSIVFPSAVWTQEDPTVVITGGSNLDDVTAVSLISKETNPATIVPGTIVSGSSTPTRLVVSFPLATSNAREGAYNLVVDKPGSPPANLEYRRIRRNNNHTEWTGKQRYQPDVPKTFVECFEVVCSDPVTFDAVQPAVIVTREALRQVRITGDNVTVLADPLNVVKLVQGATELVGTNPVVDGDDLLVTFDLTLAPAGFYELAAERGDQCNSPASLIRAFRYSPPGNQLLPNGDFELEGPKGGDATPVAFWTSYGTSIPVRYNNQTWYPTPANKGGDNRGGISEGNIGASTQRVIQTVPVVARYELTLTGWIYGGASAGRIHDHRVLIRDGGPDAAIIGQFAVTDPAGFWSPFTIKTAPTTSQVTVEWGHVPNPGGAAGGTIATHVDELLLIQSAAPCTFPVMFDADGDGDVDQADFAVFQSCYTGAGGMVPDEPEYCVCFDVEGPGGIPDNDIDQADLTRFELCASGPGVPLDPDCINP